MSIVRIERRNKFTVVPNEVARDSRLSYRARGVLVELLSRPDSWSARSEHLVAHGKEGRDAIRTALRELETVGYLDRQKEQNERGQWVTVTVVRDHVDGATEDGFPGVGNPDVGGPGATSNTEEATPIKQREKKTSSSSPSRTGRSRHDDGPDQSTLTAINDALRPGTRPTETRRVTRSRKPPAEHIHHPQKRDASGLACYWAQALEKVSSLEANEEAKVGRFFKLWLERGADVVVLRKMIDLFFADPQYADSTHRWRRFVSNAESLRQRVAAKGSADTPKPTKSFDWLDSLPAYMREEVLSA